MDGTNEGDPRRRSTFIVLGLVIAFLGLLLGLGQLALGNYQGSTYKCLVEGPFASLAEVSERADVVIGRPSVLPLGRSCEWKRADGNGTITTYSGSWPHTVATSVLVVGGIALTLTLGMGRPATLLTDRASTQRR